MFEPDVPTSVAERRAGPDTSAVGPAPLAVEALGVDALGVEVLTTFSEARGLFDEWKTLFRESGSRNPFTDPTWLLAWAEHFVGGNDLFVVAVRDRGRLCCVAPFYRRRLGRGPVTLARSLQLLGAVEHVVLTERPQILTGGERDRRVVRRVLEVIQADDGWDWTELSLAGEQGWFDPSWIDASSAAKPFVVHKTSRPSVGMRLPADLDALQSGLKRNLRESLRRARNRLNRTGAPWRIEVVTEAAQFGEAIESLMELHGARAAMSDTVAHDDMFVDGGDRDFARDVLSRLAREGSAEALFLEVDGHRVAGLMTLLAPDAVYMCFSGVEPEWWSFSAVTLLQWEAVGRAVSAGRTYADLSVGVDVAKLRWSAAVVIHPEFFVVAGRRRSRLAFAAYFLAAAAARARRERGHFRRNTSRPE